MIEQEGTAPYVLGRRGSADAGKPPYETPRLIYLGAGGHGTGLCIGSGSGDTGDCESDGVSAAGECFISGVSAFSGCVGAGSGA